MFCVVEVERAVLCPEILCWCLPFSAYIEPLSQRNLEIFLMRIMDVGVESYLELRFYFYFQVWNERC